MSILGSPISANDHIRGYFKTVKGWGGVLFLQCNEGFAVKRAERGEMYGCHGSAQHAITAAESPPFSFRGLGNLYKQ